LSEAGIGGVPDAGATAEDDHRGGLFTTSGRRHAVMTTADVRTQPGDRIEIEGHRVGEAHRLGEVLEVMGEPGREHYRVRWEDGTETIFYPGSDAHLIHKRET
jgi:hypothetical protein